MTDRPDRVLISKLGLDGHDRGARMIAIDSGTGGRSHLPWNWHDRCGHRRVASQEDVDVVGISILSGAHLPLIGKLVHVMARAGLTTLR